MLMISFVNMPGTKAGQAFWVTLGRVRCSRAVLYAATYDNHESRPRYLKIMGLHKAQLFSVTINGLFC